MGSTCASRTRNHFERYWRGHSFHLFAMADCSDDQRMVAFERLAQEAGTMTNFMSGFLRAFKYKPMAASAVFLGSGLVTGAITLLILIVLNPYGIH
ncbi:MAG: hypothetical protein AAFW60_01835 [Pseudomonadota bacterium]